MKKLMVVLTLVITCSAFAAAADENSVQAPQLEEWRYQYDGLIKKGPGPNAVAYKDAMDKLMKDLETFYGRKVEGRAVVAATRIEGKKLVMDLVLLTKDGEVRKTEKPLIGQKPSNYITAYINDDAKDPFLRRIIPGKTVVQLNGTFGTPEAKNAALRAYKLNNVVLKEALTPDSKPLEIDLGFDKEKKDMGLTEAQKKELFRGPFYIPNPASDGKKIDYLGIIRLNPDGTASKNMTGEKTKLLGKWEYSDWQARITWDDGTRELIIFVGDGPLYERKFMRKVQAKDGWDATPPYVDQVKHSP
jgi:hypothetical protein